MISPLHRWCTSLWWQVEWKYPVEARWNGKKIIILVEEEERLYSYSSRSKGTTGENDTLWNSLFIFGFDMQILWKPKENNNRHFSWTKTFAVCSKGWCCVVNQMVRMPVTRSPTFVLFGQNVPKTHTALSIVKMKRKLKCTIILSSCLKRYFPYSQKILFCYATYARMANKNSKAGKWTY